jgi:hypothetical protein
LPSIGVSWWDEAVPAGLAIQRQCHSDLRHSSDKIAVRTFSWKFDLPFICERLIERLLEQAARPVSVEPKTE